MRQEYSLGNKPVRAQETNMATKMTLSGVPETMLQTLYARANETLGRGAIHDEKAAELVRSLDYDFLAAEKDAAMSSGVIARRFEHATVFVEVMSPAMVKHFKEKSIESSGARFIWGIKSGCARRPRPSPRRFPGLRLCRQCPPGRTGCKRCQRHRVSRTAR